MARIKGQANYVSNFEVLKQAPLDSRSVVSESDDLIKKVTWQDADGNIWLYNGLMVVVPNTDTEKVPEVYILKKKEDYDKPETWVKLGADNATAVAAIQEALKKKANLEEGKVPATELPIVTSLVQDDNTTIPSAKLVNEALTAVGNTLEEKINNKVAGLLHWQGVKSTTSEIKAITSAKKGDVWHSNEDGSEWVCTKEDGISTADATAWEELGTPINLSGYYTKTEINDNFYKKNNGEALEGWRTSLSEKTALSLVTLAYRSGDCIYIGRDTISLTDGTITKDTSTGLKIPAADAGSAGIMTSGDKRKLDDIAEGANKYVHPSHTAKESGLYKVTVDAFGHVSATEAVVKADLTKLGVADSETVTKLQAAMPTAVELVVRTI